MRLTAVLFVGWIVPLPAFAAPPIATGDTAPSFVTTPIWNGGALFENRYAGKVVYLDFWATWCAPCRESFPVLQAFEDKYGVDGFAVIAVNVGETNTEIEPFLQRTKVRFAVLRDENGALASQYGLKTMPMSFIIDRQGKVAYVHTGFRSKDVPLLEQKIKALIDPLKSGTLR